MRKFLIWLLVFFGLEALLFAVGAMISTDWIADNAVFLFVAGVVIFLSGMALQNQKSLQSWVMGSTNKHNGCRLIVGEDPAWQFTSEEIAGEWYCLNRFGIVVANDPDALETARGVRVRVYVDAEPLEASTRNGLNSVDLHPGDQQVFEIGNIVAKKAWGRPSQTIAFTESARKEAEYNVSRGRHLLDFDGKVGAVLDYPTENCDILKNYLVRVTAADAQSVDVFMTSNTDEWRSEKSEYLKPISLEIKHQ